MSNNLKTPLEMLYKWEKETPNKVFLRQPRELEWTEYTWSDVADSVRRIANFLNSKNYPKGSRIGIWSSNSKDWPIVDLAIMLSGHVSVPIYPGQEEKSARYIFDHSDVKLVFIGKIERKDSIKTVIDNKTDTVAMLGCEVDCHTTLDIICDEFKPYPESPVPNADDLFSIIYTSGTTGNPKGVMHTFETTRCVLPYLSATLSAEGVDDRMFSFLPMSHIAERVMVELFGIYTNSSISFSQSLETFPAEVHSVQPTIFFAVPRLWLKFKQAIEAKFEKHVLDNLTPEQKKGIAHQLGLSQARLIITGSAPCPADIQEWYFKQGIILREAYGMTENFIHGCAWTKSDTPLPGCVGQPMDDSVRVRISDSGEIQFKSNGVMKGYYLEPEKTAEVFDGEWYCTGDSGHLDEQGNLWVTGRLSDVFKTSKGKFIVPTDIESKFARTNLFAQTCIFGHGLDQPVLLASLSEIGQALDSEQRQLEIDQVLAEINLELASHEKVNLIHITPEWTVENGLVTPTLKIKRKNIEDQYKGEVTAVLASKAQ